jgi:hypothetical protein
MDSYKKSWWGSPNFTWGSIYKKYIGTDETKKKKGKENKGIKSK